MRDLSAEKRPIVVTGATGFVGAHVCQHLAAQGERVVAILGPSGDDWRLRALGARDVIREQIDLVSAAQVRALLQRHPPRAVVNCAAYGAYPSQADAARIYQVNLEAVRILLEELRGTDVGAFVQTGSSSEYGTNCVAPAEDALPAPDSHYAIAKLAATHLVQLYAVKEKLPGVTLRLYSVYGPLEESSRLIPRLLAEAKKGLLPPLVNPDISRDFVHVSDVCAAASAAIDRAGSVAPGSVYNVGSGTKTTLRDLVAAARATFAIPAEPAWGTMADRKWDHAGWYADPRKAKAELGWQAQIALEAGLRDTMSWEVANERLVRIAAERSVLGSARST